MRIHNVSVLAAFRKLVILRYLVFGGIAAIVQLAALFMLVQISDLPEVILSCIAFIAAVVVNYSLQKAFTFNSSAPHSVVFPRFATVAVLGFVLNAFIFYAFSLYLNYLVAQVVTIFLVLGFNFLMNKKFVFA